MGKKKYGTFCEYPEYRIRIPIYLWKQKCWKCGEETPHISYDIHCVSSMHIGSIRLLDKKLMELYPYIKRIYSRTMEQDVIANTCIHCGALQGNWFIMEELIDMLSSGITPKIDLYL